MRVLSCTQLGWSGYETAVSHPVGVVWVGILDMYMCAFDGYCIREL